MSWFIDMHQRYAPTMAAKDFNAIIDRLEGELFDEHPEYLELSEEEQNYQVEQAYRRRYGEQES